MGSVIVFTGHLNTQLVTAVITHARTQARRHVPLPVGTGHDAVLSRELLSCSWSGVTAGTGEVEKREVSSRRNGHKKGVRGCVSTGGN